MGCETTLRPAQLVVWLLPMAIVSFFNSVQGVALPQVIDTLNLSYSQASLLIVVIQMSGFVSMVGGGLFIDRIGVRSVLLASIGLFTLAGLLTGLTSQWVPTLLAFGAMGVGVAMIGTSVNTAMARTGERRAFYLGVMHSTYGLVSIAAPLIAGVVVAALPWQRYYQGVAIAAVFLGAVVLARGARSGAEEDEKEAVAATREDDSHPAAVTLGWTMLRRIIPICFGIFCVVGIQRTLVTWGYLFVVESYESSHAVGSVAAALLWVGIFSGRLGNIPLSLRWPASHLLKWSAFSSLLFVVLEWGAPSVLAAFALMIALGIGVSGAFQLGTTWAAELAPASIGAASSFVMASATLGGALWPWMTGLLADVVGIGVLRWLVVAGMSMAGVTFAWASARGEASMGNVS